MTHLPGFENHCGSLLLQEHIVDVLFSALLKTQLLMRHINLWHLYIIAT